MVSKVAIPNKNAPDMSAFFNWGLKLRDIDELFIISGRPAWIADGKVLHPNDGVAQTKFILEDIGNYLQENSYTPNDARAPTPDAHAVLMVSSMQILSVSICYKREEDGQPDHKGTAMTHLDR